MATKKVITKKLTKKRSTSRRTTRKVRRLDPDNYGDITRSLRERLDTRAPVDYERGRDRMRAHLEEALECTPTRARHIVSTLVQRGYVRFGPHPMYQHNHTVGCWTYHPDR